MIQTKDIQRTEQIIVAKTCDKCKFTTDDPFFMQEFHHINILAGYGSNYFGDNNNIYCDLCEKCIYEMIKDFMRID